MGLTERIAKLKRSELREAKEIIAAFELLGISKEQLDLLPQILANWPTVAKNMNLFSSDLVDVKKRVSNLETRRSSESGGRDEDDSYGNIRKSVGLGSDIERVAFSEFNNEGK